MSGALTDTSILAGASGAGGYNIDYSCRFDDGDSAYLSKTFGTPTNNKKWTLSTWVKLGNVEQGQLLSAGGNQVFFLGHVSGQEFLTFCFAGGASGSTERMKTIQYFRDTGAWYHIVFSMDTTQAAFADQMKLYINGTQITDFATSTAVTQNINTEINSDGKAHTVACYSGISEFFDGYLAEYNFIDGQVLTPSSFGETDEDTNEWKAIKYAGTYGNNGFFLDFKNSAAFGTDVSGNGNTFASTNLAATDQMLDSPQNSTGGNFCTLNPLFIQTGANNHTLSEGNLQLNITSDDYMYATFGVESGKWYWESYVKTTLSTYNWYGVVDASKDGAPQATVLGSYYESDHSSGRIRVNGTHEQSGVGTVANGDIVGIALDMDASPPTVAYYKNNSQLGSTEDLTAGITYTAFHGSENSSTVKAFVYNFGSDSSFAGNKTAQGNKDGNNNGDFYYTPPSGYLALCTNNLADPLIALPEENFKTIKYTGTDGSRDHTGVGFSPAFVWIKNYTGAASYSHQWYDTVRGVGKMLRADTSAAYITDNAEGYLDSFDSDGFSTVVGSSDNSWTNDASHNYVAWNWRIPTAFSGATAGSGTLKTYTGIKNPEAGMSIVKFTGNGTNGHFIPHGLGKAPELTIIRYLDNSSGTPTAEQWEVLAWNFYSNIYNTTKLDVSPVQSAQGAGGVVNAAPDATYVKLGLNGNTNGNNAVLNMWSFTNIEGYQKIGSFVGNSNTDGKFVYTGFKPSMLWLAPITNVTDGNWNVISDGENGITDRNVIWQELLIDSPSNAQANEVADTLSNGFKMRKNSAYWNSTSTTMLYLAIAESPFKYSRAR